MTGNKPWGLVLLITLLATLVLTAAVLVETTIAAGRLCRATLAKPNLSHRPLHHHT